MPRHWLLTIMFTTGRLSAVPYAIAIARRASRLVSQNLAFAVIYNALAVPLAISGQVTPLIAAVAMSTSSLVVVGNGLRLGWSLSVVGKTPPLALLAAR